MIRLLTAIGLALMTTTGLRAGVQVPKSYSDGEVSIDAGELNTNLQGNRRRRSGQPRDCVQQTRIIKSDYTNDAWVCENF